MSSESFDASADRNIPPNLRLEHTNIVAPTLPADRVVSDHTNAKTNNSIANKPRTALSRWWSRLKQPPTLEKTKNSPAIASHSPVSATTSAGVIKQDFPRPDRWSPAIATGHNCVQRMDWLSTLWRTTKLAPKVTKQWEITSHGLEMFARNMSLELCDQHVNGTNRDIRMHILADTAYESLYNIEWALAAAGLSLHTPYNFRTYKANDGNRTASLGTFTSTASTVRSQLYEWTEDDRVRIFGTDVLVAFIWIPLREGAIKHVAGHLTNTMSYKKLPLIVVAFHLRHEWPGFGSDLNGEANIRTSIQTVKLLCRDSLQNNIWAFFEVKDANPETMANVVRAAVLAAVANGNR